MSGHVIGTMVKFFMRIFFATIILIFSFQSLTKSDDVTSFELEGISIGTSLLDYFSEEEILKNINNRIESHIILCKKLFAQLLSHIIFRGKVIST